MSDRRHGKEPLRCADERSAKPRHTAEKLDRLSQPQLSEGEADTTDIIYYLLISRGPESGAVHW